MSASTSIAVLLAILFASASAVPYSKYGRSCKDIGCRSDEVCVMAEDPCNSYQRDSCGRYPTCQRNSNGESCTTKFCPSGTYCKTENGKPTCVSTNPNLPPAARRPPGYVRTTPKPTPRPTPPTPPPRGSSYNTRYHGYNPSGGNGGNNNIGGGGTRVGGSSSIWDRLFGGGGGSSSGGSGSRTRPGGLRDYDKPTSKPATNYYPGGNGYYNTHTSTDNKGNRQWTFSG